MSEWNEFDRELMETVTDLPPTAGTVRAVTPWRDAMDRILLGLCLTCFSLNFLYLQYLLPAIGTVQLYLGFRTLRGNNRFFNFCWFFSICKVILLFIGFVLEATPFSGILTGPRAFLQAGITMAMLLALRQALRLSAAAADRAMGRDPLLWTAVWYAALIALALFWPEPGWVVFLLMVFAFYRIAKSLHSVTAELEEWGCGVRASSVRLSGRQLQMAYYASLLALVLLCGLLSNHIWLKAEPIEQTFTTEAEAARQHLRELGMPEEFLAQLPEEELRQLSDASACQYLENEKASSGNNKSLRLSGTMVYLVGGTARFYVLAEYADSVPLFRQNLAEFANSSTVRWDGACYLSYEKSGTAYRTTVPVQENTETVDNYFSGPSESTFIRARYSFPAGAKNRTCLFVCTQKLWESPGPDTDYYYDCIVNFYRSRLSFTYPYRPLSGQEPSHRRELTQFCQIFEFTLPQS